jgi:hypothetical protein
MNDTRDPQDARPTRSDIDDVADASFGVDTRIFRTVWDTVLFTPRVVEAAFSGDRKTYVPIIRLFLVLFGAQFAIMAFIGLPVGLTLDTFAQSEAQRAAIDAWLLENGQNYENVNRALEQAVALTTTPLTFLASLLYVLLLKAYRPSRSLFGHALAYLAPVNASYIAMFAVMSIVFVAGFVLQLPQETIINGFLFSLAFSLIWYFAAAARVIARFYAHSAIVAALQVLGLFALFFPMMILVFMGQFAMTEAVLQNGFDLSLLDMFEFIESTSPEGPSS